MSSTAAVTRAFSFSLGPAIVSGSWSANNPPEDVQYMATGRKLTACFRALPFTEIVHACMLTFGACRTLALRDAST